MTDQPIELREESEYNYEEKRHEAPKSTGVWVLPRHVQAIRLKFTDYSGNTYVPTYGKSGSEHCKVVLVLHGGAEVEVSGVLYRDSPAPTYAKHIADQLWPRQEETDADPYRGR